MKPLISNKSLFFLGVALICGAYFLQEFDTINHVAFVVDEFWFAHHVYQYKSHIPYKDFLPYKTVLGYYVLVIPYYFVQGLLTPLFYIKYQLALINTVLLFTVVYWAKKFFSPAGVVTSLLLSVFSVHFMLNSADLRVDMLAVWCGLLAVLFLLEKRFILVGLFLALSFLISQKGFWYIAAVDCSLLIYWLSAARNVATLRNTLAVNLAIIIVVAIYVIAWSAVSSFPAVLHSVFYEAYVMSKLDSYREAYDIWWHAILTKDSLLFTLWPLSLISLFLSSAQTKEYSQRLILVGFSFALLAMLISYQQPFAYNMVFAYPVFLLLYADFFSWLYSYLQSPSAAVQVKIQQYRRVLFYGVFGYSSLLVLIAGKLALPPIYFITCCLPLLFVFLLLAPTKIKTAVAAMFLILIVYVGLLFPRLEINNIRENTNNHYQISMLQLTRSLLANDGKYVAGVPLFYDMDQPIPGMKDLIYPAVAYLYYPDPKLLPALLKSLAITPTTPKQIMHAMDNTAVKLYVNNSRMYYLPPILKNYLANQYEHFCGSIYLYAPVVAPFQHTINIKFHADYLVEAAAPANLFIDGKSLAVGATLNLLPGKHTINSKSSVRLKLLPMLAHHLPESECKNDSWHKLVF